MRNFLILVCVVALIAATPAFAQQKISDAAGGFSYVAPKGWQVRKIGASKHLVAYAKPARNFAPNINIMIDDTFPGRDLDAYTKVNRANMVEQRDEFKDFGQQPFLTKSGLKGLRVVAEVASDAGRLRYVSYFFTARGGKRFYIVTFTQLAEEKAKYDKEVDAAMRTFTVH